MKLLLTIRTGLYLVCLLPLAEYLHGAELVSNNTAIEQLRVLEEYRRNLVVLEANSGPYGQELLEPLSSLAQALAAAENYTEAAQIIDRGIQVNRINHGLFSLQQLPLLQLGIEVHIRSGDWDQANGKTDYLLELYRQGYSQDSDRLLPVLASVADWHLSVISQDLEEHRAMHLLKSYDINSQLADIAASQSPQNLTQLNYYLYRQALSLFYFSAAMAVGGRTGATVLTETDTLGVVRASESIALSYPDEFEDKLEQSLTLLEQIRDSYADSSNEGLSEAEVMASIYHADWRVLFKDGRAVIGKSTPLSMARSAYESAQADLIALGYEQKQVERFFDTPALLPVIEYTESFEQAIELSLGVQTTLFNPIESKINEDDSALVRLPDFIAWSESLSGVTMPSNTSANLSDQLANLHGDIRFRVDRSGKPSRLRVLQHMPAEQSNRAELMREVQSLVFRPALINGRFRNSQMMTMRYFYPLDYRFRE